MGLISPRSFIYILVTNTYIIMKSYFHLKRLTAVYQILSFISFVPMLISMVFIIEGKAFTLETTLTLIISIIAMIGFTMRHDMYQKKLRNFDYKHYLDKLDK